MQETGSLFCKENEVSETDCKQLTALLSKEAYRIASSNPDDSVALAEALNLCQELRAAKDYVKGAEVCSRAAMLEGEQAAKPSEKPSDAES